MWIALAICGGIALFATTHLLWRARYEAVRSDFEHERTKCEALEVQYKEILAARNNVARTFLKSEAKRKETAEQLLKVTEELNALKAPRPTKGGF